MGQFSWLDCRDQSQILIGENRPAYVLVPEPFRAEYGDKDIPYHIRETHYDGYGTFGGYDIYALAADWNRESLRLKTGLPDRMLGKNIGLPEDYTEESMKKLKALLEPEPKLEEFGRLYDFEKERMRKSGMTEEQIEKADREYQKKSYDAEVKRYDISVRRLRDFLTYNHNDTEMEEIYGPDYKREIGIDIACYDRQNIKLPFPIEITHDPEAVFNEKTPSLSDEHQGVYYNRERAEAMERIEAVLDSAGVKYDIDDYYARMEFWTGHSGTVNVFIELGYDNTPKDLVGQFAAYAQNFDAEEALIYSDGDEVSPSEYQEVREALTDLSSRLDDALLSRTASEQNLLKIAEEAFELEAWFIGSLSGGIEPSPITDSVTKNEDGSVSITYHLPETCGLSDCRYHNTDTDKHTVTYALSEDGCRLLLDGGDIFPSIAGWGDEEYMNKAAEFYDKWHLEVSEEIVHGTEEDRER